MRGLHILRCTAIVVGAIGIFLAWLAPTLYSDARNQNHVRAEELAQPAARYLSQGVIPATTTDTPIPVSSSTTPDATYTGTPTPIDTGTGTPTEVATPTASPAPTATPSPTTQSSSIVTGTASYLASETLDGNLVSNEDLQPITNGRVSVPELGVDVPLKSDGSIDVTSQDVTAQAAGAIAGQTTTVTVTITAPGFGTFTYRNVPIGPKSHPILTPVLAETPQEDDVAPLPPHDNSVDPKTASVMAGSGTAAGGGCSASSDTNLYPPESIRVLENYHNPLWHDQDDHIHVVDFNFYVKHSLSREWGSYSSYWSAYWDSQALDSGAMAVKSYGWWQAMNPFTSAPAVGCYDVDSTTAYQAFDPWYATAETDRAVDATWNYYMIQGSGVVKASYGSGENYPSCGQSYDPGSWMSQDGTQDCAVNSQLPWFYILTTYYYPSHTDWQLAGAPLLASPPFLLADTNADARLQWIEPSPGLSYYLCDDSSFASPCPSSERRSPSNGINYLNGGVDYTEITIPQGANVDEAHYYTLVACQGGGYCAAERAGGLYTLHVRYSGYNLFGFYVATGAWGLLSETVMQVVNTSDYVQGIVLSDGELGNGATPNDWCPALPPNCLTDPNGRNNPPFLQQKVTTTEYLSALSTAAYSRVQSARPSSIGDVQ